jgi:glyoxylase-like metal-dependent hydrolase (beta-lactamase superfamily II)
LNSRTGPLIFSETVSLHRIDLPTPYVVGPVNVWLHKGDACVLIDAGPVTRDGFGLLEKGLKKAKVAWRDIDAVLVTHGHLDHFGMARRIRDLARAKVYAHQEEKAFLEGFPATHRAVVRAYGEASLAHGYPADAYARVAAYYGDSLANGDALPVDVAVQNGDRLEFGSFALEVLHTPGHTSGSCCYYDRRRRALFTGDTVLEYITPVSFFRSASPWKTGPSHYLRSLDKLKAVDVKEACPGHRASFRRFAEALKRIERHIALRKKRVLAAVGRPISAYDATVAAFRQDGLAGRWLSFAETLGLLEMLEEEGRVRRDGALWRAM